MKNCLKTLTRSAIIGYTFYLIATDNLTKCSFIALSLNSLQFQDDLLRIMSSSRVMAPGFRWRRSRWGQHCPVALKEGKVMLGKPRFCVGWVYLYSVGPTVHGEVRWNINYSLTASRENSTSSHVKRPTRNLWQTPDATWSLQCQDHPAGFPLLGLLRQERLLYASF